MPARIAAILFLASLALAAPAGAAVDAASTVRFAFAPQKAYQDKYAEVSIAVRPVGTRCSLSVRYVDGSQQPALAAVRATRGRATWKWLVPRSADAGPARVTASCGRAGRVSRTIVIIGATALPAKLVVERSGYTQRPDKYGPGSHVSYGIMINNPNSAYDVEDVKVLVNFLNADGRVLGSKTETAAAIAARTTYGLGGYMSLLTQVPVTRLEIVVIEADPIPHRLFFPSLVALGIEPSRFDPGWVGAVAGEVVNDHGSFTLTRAKLSIVVLASDGTILGGGSTYTFVSLPPGTRVLFKAESGFKSIPLERASTVQISVEPNWAPPGS